MQGDGCKYKFEKEDVEAFGSEEIFKKYVRFKLNIDVDKNSNLKWCPKADCNKYVEKAGLFKNIATCECGQKVCMSCGAAAHGKVPCSRVGEKELAEWSKGASVRFCPKCYVRIEKNGGCPEITCQRCNHKFCWNCRCFIYTDIPCYMMGLMCSCFNWENKCANTIKTFLFSIFCFALTPALLFLVPFIGITTYLTYEFTNCLCNACNSCLLPFLCCPVVFALCLAVAAGMSAIGYAVLLVPAMIYWVFKMVKSCNIYNKFNICWCFWCCI